MIIVIVLFFVVFVCIPFWVYYEWSKNLLGHLSSIIQGRIYMPIENIGTIRLDGTWQSRKIKIEVTARFPEMYPTQVSITLYQNFAFSTLRILPRVKLETLRCTVLSKFKGLLSVPKSKINILEEDLYILDSYETTEEEIIQKFLTLRRREIIYDIFKKKFNSIEIINDKIEIRRTSYWGGFGEHGVCKEILKPTVIDEVLRELQEFSKILKDETGNVSSDKE